MTSAAVRTLSALPADVRRCSKGVGLFATNDLPADTLVAHFDGPIVAPCDVPENEVCYALVIDSDRWLIPHTNARYANHACDPNCYATDEGDIFTCRAVRRDEELTFDYALATAAEYFANPKAHAWDSRWTFVCQCGSAHCRGRIDGYTVMGPTRDVPLPVPLTVIPVNGKGRGTIASRDIAAGERVERAPVLVIPDKNWPQIASTVVHDYTFEWGEDGQHAAVILGLGSLINHSYTPNTVFVRRYADSEIDFIALRDIVAGEEVTTNYNGDPGDQTPVWFDVVE